MIRHIVMFKLRPFENEAEKQSAAQSVLEKLDELPAKIQYIRHYQAGADLRKLEWSYDIVLVMDFESMADLDAYTVHQAHREFVAFNKSYSVEKVCADFEI